MFVFTFPIPPMHIFSHRLLKWKVWIAPREGVRIRVAPHGRPKNRPVREFRLAMAAAKRRWKTEIEAGVAAWKPKRKKRTSATADKT